ncbi:MAG: zinc-dependent metalloprotease [Aeromicrobium sp.]
MAEPEDRDEETPPENPFAGTPMEGLFAGFTGGAMPDMNALMSQMQQMFAPHEGSVNFDVAKDVARHALAAAGPDPSPNSHQVGAVDDAVRLAELWLDQATGIPAGAHTATAWSKAEWIESTAGTWQQLVEPIAGNVVAAMASAIPEEAKAMAGPLIAMLSQAGSAMFSQQIGQALAGLAGEVASSTDVGLPLGPAGVAAVLPEGVRNFGEGLGQSDADVMLYVTLRECAHHRLFQHAPWLRPQLIGAIEEFGRGTTIDIEAIESQIQNLDPSRPEEIQEALAGGLFEPQRTPAQQAALDRLESLLAFIEGWVDEVVTQATKDRMPAAASLAEAMRRRRAAGGPAEQTFASLVGLELRPRRLREATTLWAALRDRQGPEARDAVWAHPDLMPGSSDLDDPLGFAQGEQKDSGDAEFDAALNELLDAGPSDEGSSDASPSDDGTPRE